MTDDERLIARLHAVAHWIREDDCPTYASVILEAANRIRELAKRPERSSVEDEFNKIFGDIK